MLTRLRWFGAAAGLLACAVLTELLSDSAARALARAAGRLAHRLLGRTRARILRNLRLVFGDNMSPTARQRLAGAVFEHLALTVMEIMRATPSWYARNVRLEGLEFARDMVRLGRGGIAVSGHLGNFELHSAVWNRAGFRNTMLARPGHNPYLEALLQSRRRRCGVRSVSRRGQTGLREFLRRLRRGEVVGLAVDLNAPKNGVFINAWGIPASTPTGAAVVALRFNVPVVLITTHREPDGRHVVRALPAFELIRTGDFRRDVAANMQLFTDALQREILKHPEQYFWQYPRWRTRPDGRTFPFRAEYEHEVDRERVAPPLPAPDGW